MNPVASNSTCQRSTQLQNAAAESSLMKKISMLIAAGLLTLNVVAAGGPLHVLYLGSVDAGSGGRGGGGQRTNYVYLPGQTLATEAIYFDYLSNITNLTDKYLSHFDVVVQVIPDSQIATTQ